MHRFWLVGLLLLVWVLPVNAHANLVSAEPTLNAQLTTAPSAIRLRFTEPIEPNFSHIEIRDRQGNTLDLPPAIVTESDPYLLALMLNDLADGVYTVIWRVVSRTDGHPTQGSYPLVIGAGSADYSALYALTQETIPLDSSLVRMLTLISLTAFVGATWFGFLVWTPHEASIDKRLRFITIILWVMVGITSVLTLLLQTVIVTNGTWAEAIPSIGQVLTGTRFGGIWIARDILWLIMGAIVFGLGAGKWQSYSLFVCGVGLLLTQSLFSHASGTSDSVFAILADSLHLVALALWVGGLVQIGAIIPFYRQHPQQLGEGVARFSNIARLSVFLLVITGTYAGWLHVGSLNALLTTLYGQTLLIKIVLFLPLLVLGAINLIITQRQLEKGNALWTTRLRRLVMLEITVMLAIFASVGVLTAISPANLTVSARASLPVMPEPTPYFEMAVAENLMIHLTVDPAEVGDNTFLIDLFDLDMSEAINDASLIRLRFTYQGRDVGESELRPEFVGDGRYIVQGANLSLEGDWRIRAMVQRPNQFDAVVDFAPTISIAVPPPAPRYVDPTPPQLARGLALTLTGVLTFIGVMFWLIGSKTRRLTPQTSLGGVLLIGSLLLLQGGLGILAQPIAKPSPITQMAVTGTALRPWFVTEDGTVLEPLPDGTWQAVPLFVPAKGIYLENSVTVWAAAESGVYRCVANACEQMDNVPATSLMSSHGYVFGMGENILARYTEGSNRGDIAELPVPEPEPIYGLAMLGSHSHVFLNGERVYLSSSLGWGMLPIDFAPDAILRIAESADGNLLAITPTELVHWNWASQGWRTLATLPSDQPVDALQEFANRIYIVTDGVLYRLQGDAWVIVTPPEATSITGLAFQYPSILWALDAQSEQLFSTSDGDTWSALTIQRQ